MRPLIDDDALREQVSRLDHALVHGDDLEAEARLALVVERLTWHLTGRRAGDGSCRPSPRSRNRPASMLDADPVVTPGLAAIAEAHRRERRPPRPVVHPQLRHPAPPLPLGRRLDLARRRLLDGEDAAERGDGDRLLRPGASRAALQAACWRPRRARYQRSGRRTGQIKNVQAGRATRATMEWCHDRRSADPAVRDQDRHRRARRPRVLAAAQRHRVPGQRHHGGPS